MLLSDLKISLPLRFLSSLFLSSSLLSGLEAAVMAVEVARQKEANANRLLLIKSSDPVSAEET